MLQLASNWQTRRHSTVVASFARRSISLQRRIVPSGWLSCTSVKFGQPVDTDSFIVPESSRCFLHPRSGVLRAQPAVTTIFSSRLQPNLTKWIAQNYHPSCPEIFWQLVSDLSWSKSWTSKFCLTAAVKVPSCNTRVSNNTFFNDKSADHCWHQWMPWPVRNVAQPSRSSNHPCEHTYF